jgi:polar amino acid transport system permease protein
LSIEEQVLSGPREGDAPLQVGSRGSRLLGDPESGRRGVVVSVISTLFVIAIVGALLVNAPGWDSFRYAFFNADIAAATFPKILQAFVRNVLLFLTAEVFVLVIGLLIAIMRNLPGPIFTPVRAFAIIYVDVFRGLPGILVIYVFGLGLPSLGLDWIPDNEFFWGLLALVLIYSAYVSEVYRAGIDSVHPSQEAAARSLGLSHTKSLRYVVVPQAIRRIIPPLLNDFIGLTKDTALVGFIGIIEAFRRSTIEQAAAFNFTPIVLTGVLFLLLTIPLSRFVDWLVARDRKRSMATAR